MFASCGLSGPVVENVCSAVLQHVRAHRGKIRQGILYEHVLKFVGISHEGKLVFDSKSGNRQKHP